MYKSTSDSSGSSITRTNDIYTFDINNGYNNKDGSVMMKMMTANRNNQTLSSSNSNNQLMNRTIEVVSALKS
jgi:hypothetical protein